MTGRLAPPLRGPLKPRLRDPLANPMALPVLRATSEEADRRLARLAVASAALDVNDCRLLLDMLGLSS